MVPIRDPKLIGRKIDCPKCKYRFVVEEPVDEVEEGEEEAPAKKGKADGITNKKPSNGKAATAPGKRRPDDDEDLDEGKAKKKQGGSGMLIVGIVLAAVAVIALAVGAVFLFSGDSDEEKGGGRQSASAAAANDPNAQAPEKKAEPAGPKPRVDDITNLLPNDTQMVVNLPLEFLFGNAKVRQALLMTPGAFHEGAFQRTWGIAPANVRRVVLGYNAEKNTVFSIMRTSEQLNEDQIVGGLKLKAEEPINGFKHYIVKKPIGALSTFLLKGLEHRDRVSLHFMDKFTVVCADVGPMNQFLQEKGQPRQLSTQQVEKAQGDGGGAPQGGNNMQGMQGMMMQGMRGGMQGGPPGGMQGGGPPAGMQGGGPPGGMQGGPPGGMRGGAPQQGGGRGGFQPPSSMPSGMAPPSMAGAGATSTTAGAAPVSSSYLTIDPHLKAVLDQAERVDKNENQNVLLSLGVSTSAVSVEAIKKGMAEQGGNIPQVPDIALKFGLDAFKSQLKAVAVAVTEFSDTKVIANAAVGAKDTELAQEWERRATEAVPGLLTMSGLDLVAKTPPRANQPSGMAGGMMGGPGGGMMGMQGGPPGGMQGMQGMQQAQMRRMMQQQGGMQGGMMRGMQGGMMGMMGGPGGLPNMQAGGNQQEEQGKQGNYEFWTKDNVVAGNVRFNLSPAHLAAAGAGMEIFGIYLRSISAMTDRANHIHELASAMQAYFEEKGQFPRGTVSSPDSGRGLDWRPDQRLSWMTQILPYLANGEFKDLKPVYDKAWYEDLTNMKIGFTVIPQFVAPIKSDNPIYYYVNYPNLPLPAKGPKLDLWAATHFVGMAGVGLDAAEYRADDPATAKKRGVFGYDRETKKKDITDGLDQTIVLIQVPPDPKSPWIAGGGSTVRGVSEDLDCVQPFVCTEYQGKPGTFAIMGDFKVRFIPANIDAKTFQAMCTIAGGDKITSLDKVAPEVAATDEPAEPELKAKEPTQHNAARPPVVQQRPQPNPPQQMQNPAMLTNQLKMIGLAYLNYADAKGQPPSRIEDLAPFYENDAAVTAAVKDGTFVVFWNSDYRKMTKGTSNTILAYHKDAKDKGGLVLLADGSVKTMSPKEFNAAPKANGK
jgi:hypothetical protein